MAARSATGDHPGDHPVIERLDAEAYTVPTEAPESDGSLEWRSTTLVLARAHAGGRVGLGYTYTHHAAAELIRGALAEVVRGRSAMAPTGAWWAMRDHLRNTPQRGMSMFAISAVDTALWDLKARLLDLPLAILMGPVCPAVPVYASGGFTSQAEAELCAQLGAWAEQGYTRVKMKVGREPGADPARVHAARDAIGSDVELFVDANGACSVAQALRLAHEFGASGVTWFEEPRPSDDFAGLAHIRRRAPPGMEIAAGEYGDTEASFLQLIQAGAVDVLQPDITRCGGVTGLTGVASLCAAHHIPISTHCAPALTVHTACTCRPIRHMEHFADHARIEGMLFDGAPSPDSSHLAPDLARPGAGLELKAADANRFRI